MATVSDLAFGTYESFQPGSQLATPITATLTCTRSISSGITAGFDILAIGSTAAATATTGVVPNIKQGTFSFNCTRTAAGDTTSILLTATDGTHALGTQNRVQNGSRILCEAYKDSNCSAVWTSLVVSNFWTLSLLNVIGAQPVSVSYWGCITTANQVVSAGN
jgi:hypothetical protein